MCRGPRRVPCGAGIWETATAKPPALPPSPREALGCVSQAGLAGTSLQPRGTTPGSSDEHRDQESGAESLPGPIPARPERRFSVRWDARLAVKVLQAAPWGQVLGTIAVRSVSQSRRLTSVLPVCCKGCVNLPRIFLPPVSGQASV